MTTTTLTRLEYDFIKRTKTYLDDLQGPWSPYYIRGKMNKEERDMNKPLTSLTSIHFIVDSLVTKKYVIMDWVDRYRFNWPWVESIK